MSLCCQDETGSKLDGRGDSAVSKGTTDSGVGMDNREMPAIPGAVPRKLPPLTGVRESGAGEYVPQNMRIKPCHAVEKIQRTQPEEFLFRLSPRLAAAGAPKVQRDPGGAAEPGHHTGGTDQREGQRGWRGLQHHGGYLVNTGQR